MLILLEDNCQQRKSVCAQPQPRVIWVWCVQASRNSRILSEILRILRCRARVAKYAEYCHTAPGRSGARSSTGVTEEQKVQRGKNLETLTLRKKLLLENVYSTSIKDINVVIAWPKVWSVHYKIHFNSSQII